MYLVIELIEPKELGKNVAKALKNEIPHLIHTEKEMLSWLCRAKNEGILIKMYKLSDCLVDWSI